VTVSAPLAVTLRTVTDWEALGVRWRAFETRAALSFFQSWSWIGCLAPERYDNPVLLEAQRDGRTVALGLFNRRRGWLFDTLWLHETGDPKRDAVFIEHNGLLIDAATAADERANDSVEAGPGPGTEDTLRAACLAGARRAVLPGPLLGRRLILSGVDPAHLRAAAASGTVSRLTTRVAPRLDLAALRRDGRSHLDVLSANTRAQLRRSLRAYATLGTLAIQRAADIAEARRFLDELARLHQATWQHRGQPGAFADPHFARFHHALIDRALPRGEIALWRVTAGPAVIGYLYNFQHRGRVLAYQSGFDYAVAGHHAKPGLTCHHLAIEHGLADCMACYDFLAGDDRYKRSLSSGARTLHWLTVGPLLDPVRLVDRARAIASTMIANRVKQRWATSNSSVSTVGRSRAQVQSRACPDRDVVASHDDAPLP
jgi:CelD/BcsL family acetyltransferase involved in cellulose biosynthesis